MLFATRSVTSSFSFSPVANWMWRKCRRFSRLFGLICILGLDFIYYASQVSDKVPESLSGGSLVIMSALGLISLPFTLHYVQKATIDFIFGLRAKHAFVTILSVGKIVELLGIIALMLGNFAAESFAQLGNQEAQAILYEWMTPLGEGVIVLGIALLVGLLYMDQRVINALDPEVFSMETEKLVINAFQDFNSKEKIALASEIRLCMDKDTLEHFLNTLGKIRSHSTARNKIFKVVRDNVITQQKIALRGELLLVVAGYFCLGFQKYYTPNTMISASVDLVLGSAYTCKVLIETVREVMQRKKMNKVVKERYTKVNNAPIATAQESLC